MKILVTVCGCFQVGQNEYVDDYISKIVEMESVYELIEWAESKLGKSVSVNELKFSTIED